MVRNKDFMWEIIIIKKLDKIFISFKCYGLVNISLEKRGVERS